MGTRSLTVFKDGEDEVVVMYRQFDGYPTGHGADLKTWAKGKTLVNGMGRDDGKIWNGVGCMAAACVAHFKSEPGGFYLYPAGTRDAGEDYVYTLYPDPSWDPYDANRSRGQLFIKIEYQDNTLLYDGPIDKLNPEGAENRMADNTDIKQVWYFTGDPEERKFETKLETEEAARKVFPDEDPHKRYSRVYYREVYAGTSRR
jgi:hypothetical protein